MRVVTIGRATEYRPAHREIASLLALDHSHILGGYAQVVARSKLDHRFCNFSLLVLLRSLALLRCAVLDGQRSDLGLSIDRVQVRHLRGFVFNAKIVLSKFVEQDLLSRFGLRRCWLASLWSVQESNTAKRQQLQHEYEIMATLSGGGEPPYSSTHHPSLPFPHSTSKMVVS